MLKYALIEAARLVKYLCVYTHSRLTVLLIQLEDDPLEELAGLYKAMGEVPDKDSLN